MDHVSCHYILGIDIWDIPLYGSQMNTIVTLDKAGRIVIPKTLRAELHLEPGDMLDLASAGDQFTLRPVRGQSSLRKEHGVWVFRGSKHLTAAATDGVLRSLRQARDDTSNGSVP